MITYVIQKKIHKNNLPYRYLKKEIAANIANARAWTLKGNLLCVGPYA
jgi:hypothetical protein